MDNLLNAERLLFTESRICLDNSTADCSLFPLPIKIAISSAADNADLPLDINFSRGWSSSLQCLIVSFERLYEVPITLFSFEFNGNHFINGLFLIGFQTDDVIEPVMLNFISTTGVIFLFFQSLLHFLRNDVFTRGILPDKSEHPIFSIKSYIFRNALVLLFVFQCSKPL